MAVMPVYTASVGLQRDAVPNARLAAPEAEALQRVGASVEDAAGVFQRRAEQRENFKTENDYRKFNLDLGQGLQDSLLNAPEDGAGFHDGFIENVFRPRRDAFLAKVPERLRERYATLLDDNDGAAAAEWSLKAADEERKVSTKWTENELKVTQELLANAISRDPKAFEAFRKEGMDAIATAPHLTATQRKLMEQEWDTFASTAYLNRLLEDDPQLVLRELEANPNKLAPATQLDVLSRAVEIQESGGNPFAISPAGAIGTHQIMPGRARDIAKWMGDKNFPFQGDPQQVAAYLMRPGMSKRYGDFNLKKLMRDYPNDLEAVLIAYNGGEGRANEWIKAGRDDSVLPAETRNYYRKIISERLPGLTAPGRGGTAAGRNVEFVFNREGKEPIAGQSVDKLHPDLVDRVSTAFGGLGLGKVKINSGYRSPADNARVGGATKSQHLHGNAIDIDVSGYSNEEKVQMIRALSAAGINGLGIGGNVIHADIGARRFWGYPTPPKWAQAALEEHMRGTAVPPRGGGRFSTLPYDKRQSFIAAADQQLSKRITEEARSTALERVQLQQAMATELSTIGVTGQGTGKLDETAISTVLGEDDYYKYAEKKDEAFKTFTAKQDMGTMSPEELSARIDEYSFDESSPEVTEAQKRIAAAVEKEADRITKLRSTDPAKASMEFPEIRKKAEAVQQAMAAGEPQPADVQELVALMLERQKQFGIPEKALAPVPRNWAFEVGRSLTRIPDVGETVAGKKIKPEDVRAAVAVQYNALYQYFGDFTDEVIMYALSEYKGLSESDVEQITVLMDKVAHGVQDPFRLKARDTGEDKVADPGMFSFEYWFGDEAEAGEAEALEEDEGGAVVVDPERVFRARRALNDAVTDEEKAAVEREYGKAATDAARYQNEQGQQ